MVYYAIIPIKCSDVTVYQYRSVGVYVFRTSGIDSPAALVLLCNSLCFNIDKSGACFSPISYNSAISFSATALLLIIYSCIGIIVRCAVQ